MNTESKPNKESELSRKESHRHDIQFIRCKCGLTHNSYQKWIEHFTYRYMLSNSTKLPINPETQQPQSQPISFEYLRKEILQSLNIDDRTLYEIIAYNSGENSHNDGQPSQHPRKQLGVQYLQDDNRVTK